MATWDSTQNGQDTNNAWEYARNVLSQVLTGHVSTLDNLKSRGGSGIAIEQIIRENEN